MRHIAHVRLVDPHAERHRRHKGKAVLGQERILVLRAYPRLHPGMIGQRANALLVQPFSCRLDLLARQAIDDPACALVLLEKVQKLRLHLLALHDGVGNVRPVERGREHFRIPQPQPVDDVFPRHRIGRRRQRDPRHAGKIDRKARQLPIFWPEVMPPLADAMRLVDRKEADVRILQHRLEAGRVEPLWRHVEQFQLARMDLVAHHARLIGRQRGIERRRRNAGLL